MGDLDLLKDYPGLSVFDLESAWQYVETHREEIEQAEAQWLQTRIENVQYQHADADDEEDDSSEDSSGDPKQKPIVNTMPKVGRNEPCPCGSGKKFKQCHGKLH